MDFSEWILCSSSSSFIIIVHSQQIWGPFIKTAHVIDQDVFIVICFKKKKKKRLSLYPMWSSSSCLWMLYDISGESLPGDTDMLSIIIKDIYCFSPVHLCLRLYVAVNNLQTTQTTTSIMIFLDIYSNVHTSVMNPIFN